MIQTKGLSVSFNGKTVLESLDLTFSEGELVLIYGPSGGGKTTLMRALVGVIPEIIEGNVKGRIEPRPEVIRDRCVYIPQEPWFSVATPYVWSELASFTGLKFQEVTKVLENFGLGDKINRTTHTLSAGELHRVSIAVAMNSHCDYVFLDEPSSYLDKKNLDVIVEHIKELRDSGKLVVIADHNVDLWKKHSDSIIRIPKNSINDATIRTDSLLNELRRPKSAGAIVGKVHVKTFKYPGQKFLLEDVKFEIRRGDVIHIKGPSGSGKTTLLRLIARRVNTSKVVIKINGRVCYVPDNPLLYFSEPIPIKEVLNNAQILKEFNLSHAMNTPMMRTSSGERRRIAIASALVRGYDVILFDEPTVGLDLENKLKVLQAIVNVANQGRAFIIASHDPLVEEIATKVIELGEPR